MDLDIVSVKLEVCDEQSQEALDKPTSYSIMANNVPSPSNIDQEIMVKIESMEPVGDFDDELKFIIKEEVDIGPIEFNRPDVSESQTSLDEPAQKNLRTKRTRKRNTKVKTKAEQPKKTNNKMAATSKDIFTCNICSQKFKYYSNYCRHMKEFHNENSKLTCSMCQKQFKRLYALKRHQKSGVRCIKKQEINKYKCSCGKSFKTKGNLQRHCEGYCRMTQWEDERLNCEFCGKIFPNRVRLSVHYRHHKRIKVSNGLNVST